MPLENDRSSLTVGPGGQTLLQDLQLLEKLAAFDRERIPERVVHARGAGAHGYFEVTHDVTRYCCAHFLGEPGRRCDVFVRFSGMFAEKGASDSERDLRGFAVRFYTEEGNFDIVGSNSPVFFIRDAINFPDLVHSQRRHPVTNLRDPDPYWDFLSLMPESLHQLLILYSERGIPESYRHMHGYGGHTFMLYTKDGNYRWARWHMRTAQGVSNLDSQRATELVASDPDHCARDLQAAIEREDFPAWELCLQVMSPNKAEESAFDPFDATRVWPLKDNPLVPVGRLVLNRNPDNHYAEVEQSAFSPGNFVPGIGASPDRLLQGRLFSYRDSQQHRLGGNSHLIPVNRPRGCPVSNNQRDGYRRTDDNGGAAPNYWPSTQPGAVGPGKEQEPLLVGMAGVAARHDIEFSDDDFMQAREFFREVLDDRGREVLLANLAMHLGKASEHLQYRQAALFQKLDAQLGRGIASLLSLDINRVRDLSGMDQQELVSATLP